ncbi:DUF962 domain-containing protein [Companilactobacillus keshanensis]|uniref:Zinc ribbon domain-containing protein n=1 Tax=Companilactobacillus keshanensis TaxID=2486003 RepID=A0ABW4BT96_9LACO|nr:zinc ribbon domain-containing protein [Companilactobacillus keshanensis]
MENDSKRFCYKCGKELTGEIRFCPYCGADQDPQREDSEAKVTASVESNDIQKDDSKTWFILDIIGWIIFVISLVPKLDLGLLIVLALGIVIQKKYNHKVAGMWLWIPSAVLFGILFVIGFISGFVGAL